jgi:antitoxin ParD1/3/4
MELCGEFFTIEAVHKEVHIFGNFKSLLRIDNMILYINSMIFSSFYPIGGCYMGTTRKTITVTDKQDKWIKAQIAAGEYTNDSEYIRDLIRRDQARQADIDALRAALIEAEQSGEPKPFDASTFKQEMIAKHGQQKG